MDYIVNQASFTTTPDPSVFGGGFRFRRNFGGQVRGSFETVVFTCSGEVIRPGLERYFRFD